MKNFTPMQLTCNFQTTPPKANSPALLVMPSMTEPQVEELSNITAKLASKPTDTTNPVRNDGRRPKEEKQRKIESQIAVGYIQSEVAFAAAVGNLAPKSEQEPLQKFCRIAEAIFRAFEPTPQSPVGSKPGVPAAGMNTEIHIQDGDYIKDIEVNDLRNRYTLTKGSTQKMNPPLYLHITSTTKEGLDKAVAKIEELMKQELGSLVDERRFRRREPVEQVERDEFGRRKWPEERVPINLEPIPGFNLRASVVGHQGAYVKHIQQETRCRVQIKGRGSGFMENGTNRESDEPMYLHVTGPDPKEVQHAKELCEDLVKSVTDQYELFKANPPPPRYGSYGVNHGGHHHNHHHNNHHQSQQQQYGQHQNYSSHSQQPPPPPPPPPSGPSDDTPPPPPPPGASASPTSTVAAPGAASSASDYSAQTQAYNPYAAYGQADPYAAYGGYQAYAAYYAQYYAAAQQQQQQQGVPQAPGSAGAPGTQATPAPPPGSNYTVSSILYETPLPSAAPPKRHILNCLVQNEPGVLSRVSGILAARGFNIDSLVVCNTEVEDLSRMTIVLGGQDGVVEQARRQLEDLVPVWAVLDYTTTPLVQRELLLAKVSILGPEYVEELRAHHREMASDQPAEAVRNDSAEDFHPAKLPASQALRHKMEHLNAVTNLTHQFGGKVLDISTTNVIVEVSAKPARIDAFMKLIAPFGILEAARTGQMALPRSPLQGHEDDVEAPKDAVDVVDASTLPPG
ncbi:hypothetical protein Dda_0444 [Drechslerella dactyloides]|uniref:ACT domain-containing protein n=1 Tax=Drechslerella dactyloides TaxID=74499 RepID=A0AAD6J4K8_DREDA|nr:hypothetical protein Dda_0444 [Drechslerella dactyloides]